MVKLNDKKRRTRYTAISAILSALGVLLLYLGSVIEVLDLTTGAFASLIIILAVIEMNGYWPWMIYGVTSVLALIVLPNKFIAVLYLLFCGIYPIAKAAFERLHYVICWILKFSMFNSALLITIFVTKHILHIPDSGMDFTIVVFAVGNLTFLLYDIAITKLITFYLVKLRKLLGMKNYFEN